VTVLPPPVGDLEAHRDAFERAGATLAALSVDDAEQSESVRRRLGLSFPILCDTRGDVCRALDLYNAAEKGGIAKPALFVIDLDRRVRLRMLESVASRASLDDVLAFLEHGPSRGGLASSPGDGTTVHVRRRLVIPTIGQMLRTIVPALRATFRRPRHRDG